MQEKPTYKELQERIKVLERETEAHERTAEALKASHETLLTVMDSVDATIYVSDINTYEVLFINQHMRNSFGQDLEGKICYKVFRNLDEPCPHCTNDRLLDGDGKPTGVHTWEGRNPVSNTWYINYDRAIRWLDGRLVRLQVATDITDIKEAEENLKRQKEYLDALHQTALGVMSRLDVGDLFEAIIERAANLVGTKNGFIYTYNTDKDEMVAQVGLGLFSETVGMRLRRGEGLAGRILQSGEPFVVKNYSQWPGRHSDPRFDGIRSAVGIPIKSGKSVMGVIGLIRCENDLSFTKEEIAILSRFAELASIALDNARLYEKLWQAFTDHKQTERERRKLEKQLQRAQKMEAIGTLAGGVAHDLNNILSGLVSYPELLLMELTDDSPLRKPIETIHRSGQKASAIVHDLLTLARRGVSVMEVTKLNRIVTDYLESPEHKRMTSYHPDIRVETRLSDNLLNIVGSPAHLSKTVMNLVSNAAEAMPEGGNIVITSENRYIDRPIRGYDDVKEGDYAVLRVSDSGVGISGEQMERIFEPFYSKKVMGRSGTGLGMSVVWGTVKDHKGYLDIQSEEGSGTSFELYFPVTREALPIEEHPRSFEAYRGEGERILIVDDVAEQREIAARILNKLGYRVDEVSSGEEAIGYLKKREADLVVLDMIMDPGMDGLETFRRIKGFRPGQKAVIASGFSETERVKEAQRLGAGEYIKKPYSMEKIAAAVQRGLGK